eukprot:6456039-Amphidinium_carterae.2
MVTVLPVKSIRPNANRQERERKRDTERDFNKYTQLSHGAAAVAFMKALYMESEAKRRRLESSCPSPSLAESVPNNWKSRLLSAYASVCGPLPQQQRPIIIESMCSGLNTHSMVMQERRDPQTNCSIDELGLNIIDRLGCDRKPSVKRFLANNPRLCPKHICPEAEALAASSGTFQCTLHDKVCHFNEAEGSHQQCDLFVAGPPCSPYSQQRSGKQQKRHAMQIARCLNETSHCFLRWRWAQHEDFPTMLATLRYIRRTQPRHGLIENVLGLMHSDSSGEGTAYDFVVSTLRDHGYSVSSVQLCLSSWHDVVRQRRSVKIKWKHH